MSGPTKAELEEKVAHFKAQVMRLQAAAVDNDKEAIAIGECVKALDKLKETRSSGLAYGAQSSAPMRRVLHYLAERYGVEWPQVSNVTFVTSEQEVQP